MNYLHAFHAGNFADVHKHVALLALLEHLKTKPKPFFVLDTHAGRGVYDLRSSEAQRSGESQFGIGRLIGNPSALPEIATYAQSVRQAQKSDALRFYPGSPLLIASQLRERDRAVFVEQQAEEASVLKTNLRGYARVTVLAEDGYVSLKAQLPPKENRGLVLIDPPFEAADEFQQLADALQFALKRWNNGMFCVWYPIKAGTAHERFHRRMQVSGLKKLLLLELSIRPNDSPLGLNGSGLLIANPPYRLDERMRVVLPILHSTLSNDGGVKVEWLAGE